MCRQLPYRRCLRGLTDRPSCIGGSLSHRRLSHNVQNSLSRILGSTLSRILGSTLSRILGSTLHSAFAFSRCLTGQLGVRARSHLLRNCYTGVRAADLLYWGLSVGHHDRCWAVLPQLTC